jgi:hypothetical protein
MLIEDADGRPGGTEQPSVTLTSFLAICVIVRAHAHPLNLEP